MAPSRMESKEEISIAIHRALVEVYTLKEAGLSIVFPAWEDAEYDSDWGAIGFHLHGNGTVEPIYPSEEIRQKILHHLTTPEPEDDSSADSMAEDVEGIGAEESDEKTGEEGQASLDQSSSAEEGELEGSAVDTPEDESIAEDETASESPLTDKSWLNVPLDDINVKFMVGVSLDRIRRSSLTSFRYSSVRCNLPGFAFPILQSPTLHLRKCFSDIWLEGLGRKSLRIVSWTTRKYLAYPIYISWTADTLRSIERRKLADGRSLRKSSSGAICQLQEGGIENKLLPQL